MPIDHESGQRILSVNCGRLLMGMLYHSAQQASETDQPVLPFDVMTTSGSKAGRKRAENLGNQDDFEVRVEGIKDGKSVKRTDNVSVVEDGYDAFNEAQWAVVLSNLREGKYPYITSNVGDHFDKNIDDDQAIPETGPAKSHVGRMLQLLLANHAGGNKPLTVIPTEMGVERNGDWLQEQMLELAGKWELSEGVIDHIRDTKFANTLPDRIVSSGETDPVVWVGTEPFSDFYIEAQDGLELPWEEDTIKVVDDLQKPRDRKLGLLNTFHTLMVHRWVSEGREPADLNVEQMIRQDRQWADELLEELTKVVEKLVPDPEMDVRGFAAGVIDRFLNPSLDHKLDDISAEHNDKLDKRVEWLLGKAAELEVDTPIIDGIMQNAISLEQTQAGKAAFDTRIDQLEDETIRDRLKDLTNSHGKKDNERGYGQGLDSSVTTAQFHKNVDVLLAKANREEPEVRQALLEAVEVYGQAVGEVIHRTGSNKLDMVDGVGDVPYLPMLAPNIFSFTGLEDPDEKFEAAVNQACLFVQYCERKGFTAVELLGRETDELPLVNKEVAYEAVRRLKAGEFKVGDSSETYIPKIPMLIGSMSTNEDIDKATEAGADGGIMGRPNLRMAQHAMDKGIAFLPCCTVDNPAPGYDAEGNMNPRVDIQKASEEISALVSMGYRRIKFYAAAGVEIEQMQEALWRAVENPAWPKSVTLDDVRFGVTGGVKVDSLRTNFQAWHFRAPDTATDRGVKLAERIPHQPAAMLGGSELGSAFMKAFDENGKFDESKLNLVNEVARKARSESRGLMQDSGILPETPAMAA